MLEIKTKTYASSKYLCSDLNRHPEWQIVSVTDSTKPFKNPQIINGSIVDCEHCYTLFYKSEDNEDDAVSAEDAVWELIGKKDDNPSLGILPHDEWNKLVDMVSELVKKAEEDLPEKSTVVPLSQDEVDEMLDDAKVDLKKLHQYAISVLDDGQTKFLKNLKYDDNNRISEYELCYSIDDADKFSRYNDAVNIKKELIKAYRSNNELPNVTSRKVDILEVRNEQDSSD